MSDITPQDCVNNELGEVRACDCGGVNLTLGAVTIHFAAEELPALCELTECAMDLSRTDGVAHSLGAQEVHALENEVGNPRSEALHHSSRRSKSEVSFH
ncbi:MAG: hypothetical protein R3C68_18015 [Myxococcota bacterium]